MLDLQNPYLQNPYPPLHYVLVSNNNGATYISRERVGY